MSQSSWRMHDRLKTAAIVTLCLPPLLGVAVWPFVSLMSFMAFDAPGSDESPLTIGLVAAVFAYPLPTLAGAIFTFKCIKDKAFSRCWRSVLLTYAGALAIVALYVAIDVFCDGSLACKPHQ